MDYMMYLYEKDESMTSVTYTIPSVTAVALLDEELWDDVWW